MPKYMQYVSAGIIRPLSLGKKGFYNFTTTDSMSVGKHIFSKTAFRIFLKLLMKLGCLKGKKLTKAEGKNLILRIMSKNTLKIGFFEFWKKLTPLI